MTRSVIFLLGVLTPTLALEALQSPQWAPIDSPTFESNGVVLQVSFTPDGKTGYAGGGTAAGGAQIVKTVDSGKTWNVTWPSKKSKFAFNLFLSSAVKDKSHAIVGGSFFQTWTQDGSTFLPASNAFGTPPQDTGIIPGSKKFALVSGKETVAGGNTIQVSDLGMKYTAIPIPDDVLNSTNFLARYATFPSSDVWYVTCGEFPGQENFGRVNQHFTIQKEHLTASFEHSRANTDSGYSAGIVKTTDGGSTWEVVYKDFNTGNNIYPNGIHCWSITHCIAVLEGDSARIIVTRDGGKSWNETMRDDDPHSSLMAVRMLSENEAWAAGGHPAQPEFEGRFWHSLDGGDTWTKEAHPGTYIISLDMITADSGYAVALTQSQPAGIKLFKYSAN